MTLARAEAEKNIKSAMGRRSMKKPLFKPKPGQTDFTNVRWAPVINCVLKHKNKLLVVQRSKELNFYPGYWNGVSGFLDDQRSLNQKVSDELTEELGIAKTKIKKVQLGEIFDQEEPKYKKTWIVHPVLVEVKTDKVKLDWEAKNYKWLTLQEIKKLKLLPGFDEVLRRLSSRIRK
jgi:ADP-ribose pyrophosphatase YjhB (NUDIX family)